MKKIKTYLLIPLLLLFVFMSLTAYGLSQKENTWEKVEESKTITIGYEADFAPLSSSQENQKPTGFNVALAEAIFDSYNIQIRWRALDWSAKEKALKEGEVDLIWGPYIVNKAHKKDMLFSQTYLTSRTVLLVPRDAKIYNIGDMHDLLVGGQKASVEYEIFGKYPHVLKNIVKENLLFLYDKPSEAVAALQEGKVEALLLDEHYAKTYLKEKQLNTVFNILSTPYPQENYVVAARKGDKELISKVDQGLQELRQSGELSKLSQRWFQP